MRVYVFAVVLVCVGCKDQKTKDYEAELPVLEGKLYELEMNARTHEPACHKIYELSVNAWKSRLKDTVLDHERYMKAVAMAEQKEADRLAACLVDKSAEEAFKKLSDEVTIKKNYIKNN